MGGKRVILHTTQDGEDLLFCTMQCYRAEYAGEQESNNQYAEVFAALNSGIVRSFANRLYVPKGARILNNVVKVVAPVLTSLFRGQR
jgi:hypothetical protein